MPGYDATGIEYIRRQSKMATFSGIALDVAVTEEPLFGGFLIPPRQADDDDMDGCDATCVATPCEGTVCKADLESIAVKENRPELGDLFSLCDRIGCNEPDLCSRMSQV